MIDKLIQKADLFGVNFQLTHNENTQYRTVLGGCVSIAVMLTFTALFAIQLHEDTTNPIF